MSSDFCQHPQPLTAHTSFITCGRDVVLSDLPAGRGEKLAEFIDPDAKRRALLSGVHCRMDEPDSNKAASSFEQVMNGLFVSSAPCGRQGAEAGVFEDVVKASIPASGRGKKISFDHAFGVLWMVLLRQCDGTWGDVETPCLQAMTAEHGDIMPCSASWNDGSA